MKKESIEKSFREKVCEEISLYEEGVDRYRVFTPFQFDDGDHFSVILKRKNQKWYLSDEGFTIMHLSYDVDLKQLEEGSRQNLISNALKAFRGLCQVCSVNSLREE